MKTDLTWFNDKNGIGSHESTVVRRLNKGIGLWLQGASLLDHDHHDDVDVEHQVEQDNADNDDNDGGDKEALPVALVARWILHSSSVHSPLLVFLLYHSIAVENILHKLNIYCMVDFH